jgi:peptidylprolyl isomerase
MNRVLIMLFILLLSARAIAESGFMSTPGGALYKDVVIGGGLPAVEGDVATIHFRGWLSGESGRGKEIVNSRSERQPISFVIGTDRVMPGWNEGVIGMREGGKRLVKLPPELGFGAKGSAGVIPPNSGLVFMMELVTLRKAGE